jgi:hypothetical protein
MLVKAMETLPAVAVSEVLLYFSWPSGLAWRLSARPALAVPLAGAGVEDVPEVDLVGAAGRAFGLKAGGLGAGVDAAAEPDVVADLDVVGVAGWPVGVDAGGLGVEVDAATELDVVGATAALAGVDAEMVVVVVLPDEPPQPASASRPRARVSVESLDMGGSFA